MTRRAELHMVRMLLAANTRKIAARTTAEMAAQRRRNEADPDHPDYEVPKT